MGKEEKTKEYEHVIIHSNMSEKEMDDLAKVIKCTMEESNKNKCK